MKIHPFVDHRPGAIIDLHGSSICLIMFDLCFTDEKVNDLLTKHARDHSNVRSLSPCGTSLGLHCCFSNAGPLGIPEKYAKIRHAEGHRKIQKDQQTWTH